jgi:hypothetical protein
VLVFELEHASRHVTRIGPRSAEYTDYNSYSAAPYATRPRRSPQACTAGAPT